MKRFEDLETWDLYKYDDEVSYDGIGGYYISSINIYGSDVYVELYNPTNDNIQDIHYEDLTIKRNLKINKLKNKIK